MFNRATYRLQARASNWLPIAPLLAAGCACSAAIAQSSYTLTTLKTASMAEVYLSTQIDSANRATARIDYVTGYNFNLIAFSPNRWIYTAYVSRWAATPSATVTATKLIKTKSGFASMSPDGSKIFGFCYYNEDCTRYYDTERKAYVPITAPSLPSGSKVDRFEALSINDAGQIAGTAYLPYVDIDGQTVQPTRALRWATASGAPDVLAIPPGHAAAAARLIDNSGRVLGTALRAGTKLNAVVRWEPDGQAQVLSPETNEDFWPVATDSSGTVLAVRRTIGTPSATGHVLLRNGQAETLPAPFDKAGELAHVFMNRSGMIAATLPSEGAANMARAYLLRNNAFVEAGEVVRSLGAKIPAGSKLISIDSLNDAGSFTGKLQDSQGKITYVRLTAAGQ